MQTDLSLWEDENRLVSAGVSPRVLLSALAEAESNTLWFSRVYGEFHDNLDIVATTEAGPSAGWLELYPGAGPVDRFIGDLYPVREFALNDAVAQWVGLAYVTVTECVIQAGREVEIEYEVCERLPTSLPRGALHLISCHDECFCNIIPATDVAVRRTIAQVLGLHSYYHNKDYDWTSVAADIMHLLSRYKALRLRSRAAGRLRAAMTEIRIPRKGWSVDQWREQQKMPHFELAASVTFDDGTAQLRLHSPGRATKWG